MKKTYEAALRIKELMDYRITTKEDIENLYEIVELCNGLGVDPNSVLASFDSWEESETNQIIPSGLRLMENELIFFEDVISKKIAGNFYVSPHLPPTWWLIELIENNLTTKEVMGKKFSMTYPYYEEEE